MRLAAALSLLGIVLVLVAAACGGGNDEAGGDTDAPAVTETDGTTTQDTTTDEDTTDEDTTDEDTTDEDTTGEDTTDETTTDGGPPGVSGVSAEKCVELIGIGAAIGQALAGTGGESDLDEAARLFEELASTAPTDIRGDIEVLASFVSKYAAVYRDLDLEPGEAPSGRDVQKLQDAITSVGQPKLQAASERLSAWAAANCSG